MNDNIQMFILSTILIAVGVGMFLASKDEVHILVPLANLGICTMILTGIILLIISIIHLI